MTNGQFCDWIREVYSIFGKKYPDTHISDAIYGRVSDLPDDFLDFAMEIIQDRSDLPKNFGAYLRLDLWPEYLSEHPEKKAARTACPECSHNEHGFFWAWDRDGRAYYLKCACNSDPHYAKWTPYTHKEALEQGLLLKFPYSAKGKSLALDWKKKFPMPERTTVCEGNWPAPEPVMEFEEYCPMPDSEYEVF